MKKHEAEKLVTDTFTRPYDETRFRNFVGNLFQEYEALSEKASSGTYVPEAFRDGVVSFKRLAKFTDPEGLEVDVLAVKLSSKRTLESARTMQRNFVARYLNGSRGGALKDAALVAFFTEEVDDWRFSLVRMDYVLDEEKQKVRKELTPARRYSFLVGHTEGTHTARRQWLPVLQTPDEISLAELEAAFNIETVTKEFFEKYKTLYLRLKEALDNHVGKDSVTKAEFDQKGILTADFAKRLLGQIVFLYFLQKKGWLGVEKGKAWGTGPKDFMQRLYRLGDYTNFFNEVLEHLFYDALATERQTQDHFYAPLNCKIPFLNGGLFEPFQGYAWDDTDILLDNRIFEEIFSVFDLYNFTVREDEPLDKEVAVDPEMLGKVFENLIPENERKGSGTFYTPREIVHYMCQESLINYLDMTLNVRSNIVEQEGQQVLLGIADEKVLYREEYKEVVPRKDIEAFIHDGDSAQEHDTTAGQKHTKAGYKGDYKFRVPLSIRDHAGVIDNALAEVKVCDPAIGSGAFPLGTMNEIVRARGALNAYLGEEGRSSYDFKRHAIQTTIYGADIESSAVDIAKLRLWLSLVVDEDDFGSIKPLPNLDYKIVTGNSLLGFPFSTEARAKKLRELTPLKEEYFDSYSPSRKAELQTRINSIIQSEYDAPVTARSLGYKVDFDFRWSFFEVFDQNNGFDIVIGNPPYVDSEVMVKENPVNRKIIASQFSSAKGNWDLYIPFWELSFKLLGPSGTATLITPNKWLAISYGAALRRFLENNTYAICDYSSFRAFDQVGVFPVVSFASKFNPKTELCVKKFRSYDKLEFASKLPINSLRDFDNWGCFTSKNLELLTKIALNHEKLGECSTIAEPATVGEAYELKEHMREFVEGEDFKFVNTGTIDPYITLWGRKPTTYLNEKYKAPGIPKKLLKSRFLRRYEQTVKQKLIFSGMRHFEVFYDDGGVYLAGKSTAIAYDISQRLPLFYLLGILNSRLVKFFFKEAYGALGMDGGINFSPKNISQIPVPEYGGKISEKIDSLVKEVTNKIERCESFNDLASQIDVLVYQLFDLSPKEVSIIEQSVKSRQ